MPSRRMSPMIPEIGTCCPGHDKWASDHYNNRRSVRAHARDTARAHRVVRRRDRLALLAEVRFEGDLAPE